MEKRSSYPRDAGGSQRSFGRPIGRLVGKFNFPSEIFGGFAASISARSAWRSLGVRRRGASKPKFLVISGGPFQPNTVYSGDTQQLSVESWTPANFQHWPFADRAFSCSFQEVSSNVNQWTVLPRFGAAFFSPRMVPRRNTESIPSLQEFFAPPATPELPQLATPSASFREGSFGR